MFVVYLPREFVWQRIVYSFSDIVVAQLAMRPFRDGKAASAPLARRNVVFIFNVQVLGLYSIIHFFFWQYLFLFLIFMSVDKPLVMLLLLCAFNNLFRLMVCKVRRWDFLNDIPFLFFKLRAFYFRTS